VYCVRCVNVGTTHHVKALLTRYTKCWARQTLCKKCNSVVLKVLKSAWKLMDKIGEVEAKILSIQGETRSENTKVKAEY